MYQHLHVCHINTHKATAMSKIDRTEKQKIINLLLGNGQRYGNQGPSFMGSSPPIHQPPPARHGHGGQKRLQLGRVRHWRLRPSPCRRCL